MKDLKRAFGSPDPEFQERVRETLFRIEEKEEAIVKKKMTFSMALALILCVCIVTVSAFAGTTLLTNKPDVTQSPLSHSENENPNGTNVPVLSTQTPQPSVTPEPAPAASADPEFVWSAEDDKRYHADQLCTAAEKGLSRVTLAVAENRRQTACPICYPIITPEPTVLPTLTPMPTAAPTVDGVINLSGEVFWPDNSNIYHAIQDCSGMSYPGTIIPLYEAMESGVQPCPLCAEDVSYIVGSYAAVTPEPTEMPFAQLTPTPMPIEALDYEGALSSIEVYLSANSDTFHADLDCEDLSSPYVVSYLATALAAADQPCPLCFHTGSAEELIGLRLDATVTPIPTATPVVLPTTTPIPASEPDAVYSSADDSRFHRTPVCGEISASLPMALNYALNAGYLPCSVCYGSESVYTVNGGDRYHHPDKACFLLLASSSNSLDVSLTEALLRGKLPCEECVLNRVEYEETGYYYSHWDSYYHCDADCAHADELLSEQLPENELLLQGKRNCPWCLSWYNCYYSAEDAFYHKTSGCERFFGAPQEPNAEANLIEMGKLPCPECFPSIRSGKTVYLSEESVFYHSAADCAAFELFDYSEASLESVAASDKSACPACMLVDYIFWPEQGGEHPYYHMRSACSVLSETDVTGSVNGTLYEAQSFGKTLCPDCASSAVLCSLGDACYHLHEECLLRDSDTRIVELPLFTALNLAAEPCADCIPDDLYYFYEYSGRYHATLYCGGVINGDAGFITKADAEAAGLIPCADCLAMEETNASLSDTQTETAVLVYSTPNGSFYHTVSDCTGMKNAESVSLAAALSRGQTACLHCIDPDEPLSAQTSEAVSTLPLFSTPNGTFYHIISDCSGMKNAEAVALFTALERNQTACPVCLPRYITDDSTLYHMSESCSRLSGAQVQPTGALPDEYDACGLCVRFLDLNSNLYHRFPRCSEFGGDDQARAYIPCSADLTAQLGSTPCELCASGSASVSTATTAPAPDFAERELLISEAGSDTTVFLWDSSAPVYHAVYNCSGYEYLHQMELTDAVARSLTPCPECLNTEDTVWYAQDSSNYHSYLHYAFLNLPDVIERTPAEALADGKRPCENCMLTETAKGDATLGSVPPLWATGNDEIYFYDYTEGHSAYFHAAASCEAHPMSAPVAISSETAVRYELHPCPECTNLLKQVISAAADDKLYHTDDECKAFASPESLTRWDAKKLGLAPCPDCAQADINRSSPLPTVPPQPTMPPSDDQEALKSWVMRGEEETQCLTDLGYLNR